MKKIIFFLLFISHASFSSNDSLVALCEKYHTCKQEMRFLEYNKFIAPKLKIVDYLFLRAAFCNDLKLAQRRLCQGADISASTFITHGYTALHLALRTPDHQASLPYPLIMMLLHTPGIDVARKDPAGKNAIDYAHEYLMSASYKPNDRFKFFDMILLLNYHAQKDPYFWLTRVNKQLQSGISAQLSPLNLTAHDS